MSIPSNFSVKDFKFEMFTLAARYDSLLGNKKKGSSDKQSVDNGSGSKFQSYKDAAEYPSPNDLDGYPIHS